MEVRARRPALLLVRNTFDLNWNATIDDRPAEVLQTDYALQGISVPRGRHTVRLLYRDPSIGRGVIGSVLSIAVLLGGESTPVAPERALTAAAARRRPIA